jgi:hypothetical protein
MKYYYRPINPEILLTAGFSGFNEGDLKNDNNSISSFYKISNVKTLDLCKYDKDKYDFNQIYDLYKENMQQYSFSNNYTSDQLKQILCNKAITTWCVVSNCDNNKTETCKIIDFVCTYNVQHESKKNKKITNTTQKYICLVRQLTNLQK